MTMFADNQPTYYTTRGPAYLGVEFDVIARGEIVHVDEDDMCDPTQQTLIVAPLRTEGACDARDIARMISRAVSPARCYCEHDCCGHRHGGASTRWLAMDRLELTIYTSRNY